VSDVAQGDTERSASATEEDRESRDDKIEEAKAQLGSTQPAPAGKSEELTKKPRRWWHRHLDSEERQRILAELGIKRQDHWAFRFTIMSGLSVVVAVMGLSADSAAVVIGAMLLAPLMQPVLATAACISMALFRKSLRSAMHVLLASVGSIALAYVLSALFVTGELPNEVTSRTAPDIRDLVVALGAGTAGAYATVRKDVSSSLPGVAVAVALVPPLGVVGITLEDGSYILAQGALLLYATNLAAIVLASSIVFVATGFVPPRRLANTFWRTAAVSVVVAIVVIAIAIPLFDASRSVAERAERRVEANEIVSDWLSAGGIDSDPDVTPADVSFNESRSRIEVRIRSTEAPIDDEPLTDAMQAAFGLDQVVSLEWDRLARFEVPTTLAPTTTVVTDAELLTAEVGRIVDDWLQEGEFDGVRRVDSLIVSDGIVRLDASGVGEPPEQNLSERLDEELDETLEVQLTWVERRNVTPPVLPTPDELLAEQITALANEWADDAEVTVIESTYADADALVQIAGEEAPDASDLVADIEALLPEDAQVTVLFVERRDITDGPGSPSSDGDAGSNSDVDSNSSSTTDGGSETGSEN
jgi:uncharacterized hydrophobic protein (TIGR00271 family)